MSTPTEPRYATDDGTVAGPMHPADERILSYLNENPPDYVPLVANRLGMHLGYVERRVETLVELGLVQPVSEEVIYTLTDRGEGHLTEGGSTAPVEKS